MILRVVFKKWWGCPPPTMTDHIRDFLKHPDLLFYLFIILGIYSIFLGIRLYAMCSKTEHNIMPLKIAGIMNVHNYGMELTGIEAKIRRCDQELRRIKMEADQLFQDTIDQPSI